VQGELSEIDVRSICQLIELGQRTGQLWLRPYAKTGEASSWTIEQQRSWFVFWVNGQLAYAGNPAVVTERLKHFLQRQDLAIDWAALARHPQAQRQAPEYGCLWVLLEQRQITPAFAQKILDLMLRETLFELLSLHHGMFVFEAGTPLMPQLPTLATTPMVTAVMQQVQEWHQFYPLVQSPLQAPIVTDAAALCETLPPATAKALIDYAQDGLSLKQLARVLHRDLLTVVRAIAPCIQRGWISLTSLPSLPPTAVDREPGTMIVCVDDALTMGQLVVSMLVPQGYAVTALTEPVAALSQMFQLNPQLILCDIEMPELDGYELCAMLRQSSRFHAVPIIMLTGKDGFIDRVRAKMVGATDYLAKPFTAEELVMLVERYLPPTARMAVA
jgi:twitching motility two-component system response regulator PilG